MKVVHIYRPSREGAFSIETLFHAITSEINLHVDLIEYELGPRTALIRDVWCLRRTQADIYHVTGDVNYLVFFLPRNKTVLTVHDIGHYLFGLHGIKRWLYKWLWLIFPIRTAAAVTTVSQTTADNIVDHLGITRYRLTTIENCYSPLFRYIPRHFKADYPVILQVGTKPYKNVPRLIAALKDIPCKLVLIGPLDAPIQRQLEECGTDFECRTNLSHAETVQAYIDCDLVTFISFGEGFGIPIIEAQASGRPVVTANISPLCDVAGEDACLASPLDVRGIRAAILRIIHDDGYRNRVVQAGLHNAKRFSPQIIAGKYSALYKRVSHQ